MSVKRVHKRKGHGMSNHLEKYYMNLLFIVILGLSCITISFIGTFAEMLALYDTSYKMDILLFSILEYINYFHIQLSYDNSAVLQYLKRTKRLKRASLSRDFERLNSQVR